MEVKIGLKDPRTPTKVGVNINIGYITWKGE